MSTAALEYAAAAAELSGDAAGAVQLRRELVRMEPDSPAARLALANAFEHARAWPEAVRACGEALQRGAEPADAHRRIGELYLRAGKPPLALQHFRKSLAADPDHPETLFRTGVTLHRLRRFREAADVLRRAIPLRPEAPELHFNLGLALFELGDLCSALGSFARSHSLKRGGAWNADPVAPLAREPSPPFPEGEMRVNEVKLQHDLEQIEYLMDEDRLPAAWRPVADQYRGLLQEMRGFADAGIVVPFNVHRYPLVARTLKRPVHVAEDLQDEPVLNPKLDARRIENAYARANPNLVVVDDLLNPDALDELRRFCRESSIWNNVQSGYLGAYFFDGFASGPLLSLARDLRDRFPRIFRGLPLQMLWGYKYDHQLSGIGVHADAAAVNLNFWITEDEANLDPASGGLLVYRKAAPLDWDFEKFNRAPAEIMEFLGEACADPIRISHRANRAVIFDSDLFHATDTLNFRKGYRNRRINITLLYGLRS